MITQGFKFLLFTLLGCLMMSGQTKSLASDTSWSQRELNFSAFIENDLVPFWQHNASPGEFKNSQGLSIKYVSVIAPDATEAVIISPGRVEGYLKYQELAYDFVQQGYSVFIIDHQGQGLSARRLSNPHKGYVESFDDYVTDFAQFIDEIVQPQQYKNTYLVAHSMGGAIAIRYLQTHPKVITKAVLSSPMLGFRSGPVPNLLAKSMVELGHWASNYFADESPYFIGGENYQDKVFAGNELTGSSARYDYFRQVYRQYPEVQLGGVTFAWLKASVEALEQIFAEVEKIETPILMFQSELDTVIENQAQNDFCGQLKALNKPCYGDGPITIKGAKHELFIETDPIRQQVLSRLFDYIKQD